MYRSEITYVGTNEYFILTEKKVQIGKDGFRFEMRVRDAGIVSDVLFLYGDAIVRIAAYDDKRTLITIQTEDNEFGCHIVLNTLLFDEDDIRAIYDSLQAIAAI